MVDQLGLTPPPPLSVMTLLVNLVLGTILAFALAWHYRHFGQTHSNRNELAQVFPLIVLVTTLIISVVKSSLALSLGLVGALSIVRFRTPIKEPEELAYLFTALAIGLGFGADQRIATVVAAVFIMSVLIARSRMKKKTNDDHNLYFNVDVPEYNGDQQVFRKINGILRQHTSMADLRRLDVRDGVLQATYFIDCQDSENLISLMDGLNGSLPGVAASFVERKGIPGA